MAQYEYDPAALPTGAAPGLTAVAGAPTMTIVDVGGERVLRLALASSQSTRITLDAVGADPDRDDVEVYVRYRVPSDGLLDLIPLLRLGAGPVWYRAAVAAVAGNVPFHYVQRFFGGVTTYLAGGANGTVAPAAPAPAAGDALHVVYRVNGNAHYLRYWLNAAAEPGAYQLTASDSSIPAAGGVGLAMFAVRTYDVEFIGVGTGGDLAPRASSASPLAAGSVALADAYAPRTDTTAALVASPASGGASPHAYQWQRAPDSGGSPGAWADLPGETALTLEDAGLTPATTYHYRVVVTDDDGATAESAPLAVTTLPATLITAEGTAGTYQQGSHLRAGGKTWVCWALDAGEHYVTEVDEATGAKTATLLGTVAVSDRHMVASLALLPDGRLFAVYGDHDAEAWCRVSAEPYDAAAWGDVRAVAPGSICRYMQPVVTDEGSGTERVYVFHTTPDGSTGRTARLVYTDDRGATWSTPEVVFSDGAEWLYVAARRSAATGRILLGLTDGNPDQAGATSAYLMAYDPADGTWRAADGTALALPQAPSPTTLLYDASGTSDEVDWLVLPYEDEAAIYAVFRATDRTSGDSNYYRAVYPKPGGPWDVQPALAAYDETLGHAPVMNDGDPDTVFGIMADAEGVRDVYAFTTDDGGATWEAENLTNGAFLPTNAAQAVYNLAEVKGGAGTSPRWVFFIWEFAGEEDFQGVVYLSPYTFAPEPVEVQPDAMAVATALPPASLRQTHRLAGHPLAAAPGLAAAGLRQTHRLAPDALAVATGLGAPALRQTHRLQPAALAVGTALAAASLTSGGEPAPFVPPPPGRLFRVPARRRLFTVR